MTGLDGNRVFEAYTNSTGVKTYLLGYTLDGVKFFTNRIAKSIAVTAVWTDVDISADTGAETAIGAIFTAVNVNPSNAQFGLRRKGSIDDHYSDLRGEQATLGLVGVDASENAQQKIESTDVDLYLIGYVTHGAVFFTNAVPKLATTAGSYEDVDITAELGGDRANGAFVEHHLSTNTRRLMALRPNGATDESLHGPLARLRRCRHRCRQHLRAKGGSARHGALSRRLQP